MEMQRLELAAGQEPEPIEIVQNGPLTLAEVSVDALQPSAADTASTIASYMAARER